jgi:AraC-like DNA-binding protein
MPVYMDRHNVSETVTAEHVAQLHREDLKVQHKFGCRGLTYWFDEKRKTAFCLVDAPNEQAINDMHEQAHGEIPHEIIEVDENIVESFLGRIEDPEKSKNTELNIINDPAFRTIMVIGLEILSLKKNDSIQVISPLLKYNTSIIKILIQFEGSLVKQNENDYLVSFRSVSKAVLCALEIKSKIKEIIDNAENSNIKLKIALSAGVPVSGKGALFEETIKLAERMCNNVKSDIVVSNEVKELYKSENLNTFFNSEKVFALKVSTEKFLNQLVDYTEKIWKNSNLKVDDFSKQLGFSKSQLYRQMMSVTGNSPNTFLKEYRLNEALKLLNKQKGNVSEIAFETGFNSVSYFSKCFHNRYGLLPSDYLRTK